jgi:hypothetical protein
MLVLWQSPRAWTFCPRPPKFITELRFADGKLIVTNEKNEQFELDPATQALKVLKG